MLKKRINVFYYNADNLHFVFEILQIFPIGLLDAWVSQ